LSGWRTPRHTLRAHRRWCAPRVVAIGHGLLARGVADEAELERLRRAAERRLEDALEFMRRSPEPDPSTLAHAVFAP
jgi:TPP-dependent pyruvate/acetoin dehydrogenase alpha subunit